MTYHIDSRTMAEQPTAVVRANLRADQLGSWLPAVYQEVVTYLASVGVVPAGPPYARFTFHDERVDAEAGFPVSSPVAARGRVTASSLPAGPAAVTTHYGRYEDLPTAYDAVAQWLKEHDYQPDGPHWEVYYTDPQAEPDPSRWRTDLVIPYQSR